MKWVLGHSFSYRWGLAEFLAFVSCANAFGASATSRFLRSISSKPWTGRRGGGCGRVLITLYNIDFRRCFGCSLSLVYRGEATRSTDQDFGEILNVEEGKEMDNGKRRC
jgi:hypothetical protein